jgi:hypothetical protein
MGPLKGAVLRGVYTGMDLGVELLEVNHLFLKQIDKND